MLPEELLNKDELFGATGDAGDSEDSGDPGDAGNAEDSEGALFEEPASKAEAVDKPQLE